MGLFSFLKSDKPLYKDKVWKTKAMAIKEMVTDALLAIKQNDIPVIFSYFEDKRSEIISFFDKAGVPYFSLEDDSLIEVHNKNGVVFLGDTSLIVSSSQLTQVFGTLPKNRTIQFLFAGHYPLPSKENKLIENLSSSFSPSTITFYSSIDDPSFEPFGSDKIISVLDQMGLKEEECIQHPMVSKAMANARISLEGKVHHEILSRFESDWFVKNVKK